MGESNTGTASIIFEHVMLYRLMRRWAFLQGLEPAEIQGAMDGDEREHPKAFRSLSREVHGHEIDMREATRAELHKMRDLLRDRITTLQTTPRAAENDWYPDNWRAAMGGKDAANEGGSHR